MTKILPDEFVPLEYIEFNIPIDHIDSSTSNIKNKILNYDYPSCLYREMDDKYIKKFFIDGSLRLSTLKRCRTLENLNRKDKEEGSCKKIGIHDNIKAELDMQVGDNNFLLCTQLQHITIDNKGQQHIGNFKINNISSFIIEIYDALKQKGFNVYDVLVGNINYGSKVISKNVSNKNINPLMNGDNIFSAIANLSCEISTTEEYFIKEQNYNWEQEYRIVFLLNDQLSQDYIDIKIPNARKYCTRLLNH